VSVNITVTADNLRSAIVSSEPSFKIISYSEKGAYYGIFTKKRRNVLKM
jgi:hypothetical protein